MRAQAVTSEHLATWQDSHEARLAVFKEVLEVERKRLSARSSLQSLFKK